MSIISTSFVGPRSGRPQDVLPWAVPRLAVVSVLIALYFAFVFAETEATMGVIQRIFYFHVACAWVAFLAFFVVFVASIAYLRTRNWEWDSLACSSA